MRSGFSVLSTLALGGGLVLALAGPAQAAVPAGSCGDGTTFAVTSGPSVDAALVSSVTDAFAARGFSVAPASSADLSATIAPASEIAEFGSATVMGVAISAGDLDPATATEGKDWVAVTGAAGDAAEQLLEGACGALPAEEQDPADESEPAEDPSEAVPAPAQQKATTETQAKESKSSTAKGAAPATGSTSERQETASANEKSAAPAPAAAAPAAAATPETAATPESAATGSAPSSRPAASAADKDCGDFGSQEEAQTFFEDNGGPSSDGHRLDADDDGQACEDSFSGEDSAAVAVASTSGDKDCADFSSRAKAQAFFTSHGGPATDSHRLDRDNDGQACEDDFGGDNASRAEARTIHAGSPAPSDAPPLGLAGGALLALAGVALGLRARRLG